MLILFLLFGFTIGEDGLRSLSDYEAWILPREHEAHKERRK